MCNFVARITIDTMDIKELYSFYKEHAVVTTDSRECPEGSIFIALKGESFDGNKFAVQALEKGSLWSTTSRSITHLSPVRWRASA